MKKIIALSFTVVLLFSTFTASAYNYTEFNFEEIYFSVPEYCSETSFNGDYYTIGKWQTDDASVEFTLKWEYNYDELYFPEITREEIISFYHSYFYPDENQLKIDSAEVVGDFGFDTVLITGAISDDEVKSDYTAYLFFTDEYVYVLEFEVYGEDTHGCIGEVVSSVYIEPYYADGGKDYYEEYDDDEEILAVLPIVFFSGFAVLFKVLNKKEKSKAKQAPVSTNNPVPVQQPKAKTDYELNGKNINNFNERIVTGSSRATGFAARELERERKDREKMFK